MGKWADNAVYDFKKSTKSVKEFKNYNSNEEFLERRKLTFTIPREEWTATASQIIFYFFSIAPEFFCTSESK